MGSPVCISTPLAPRHSPRAFGCRSILMTAARNENSEPGWAKRLNWPERRRAPGYPRRFLIPSFVVLVCAVGLLLTGFGTGRSALVWAGLALFLVGHAIVYRFTLSRFCCPECGQMLTLKGYPAPGTLFRFHCRGCNIVWLTGVRVGDDVAD
jgi:hypothetical protein